MPSSIVSIQYKHGGEPWYILRSDGSYAGEKEHLFRFQTVSILPHLSHEIQKSWIIEILSLASSHDYDIVDSNKRAAREGIISDSSSDAIAARGQIAQTTLGC